MASNAKASQSEVEARKRQFEKELSQWEVNGDPLTAWVGYLSWLEDHGLKSQEYKQTLQKCVSYFKTKKEYYSEIRLARIYISAAEMCKDPLSIYKHMQSNGIGVKYAPFYRVYAMAVAGKGDKSSAVKILELGIQREAKPASLLQKTISELKAVKAIDEKSERNEAFYNQLGVLYCYEKEQVYPRGGGEFSLEQVRALKPQYLPTFSSPCGGECDMEMTCAMTMVDVFRAGKMPVIEAEEDDSFEIYQDDSSPVETAAQPHKPSPEEELELLIAEKNTQPIDNAPMGPPLPEAPLSSQTVSNDSIESELEQLVFEKQQSTNKTGPSQTHEDVYSINQPSHGSDSRSRNRSHNQFQSAPIFHKPAVHEKENVPSLANQEPTVKVKKEHFDFTPTTGIALPKPAEVAELVGRLNFSEAELSLHQKSSLAESFHQKSGLVDSFHQRGIVSKEPGLNMFNTTLDCEKRAKLTAEQAQFENEFAATEFATEPLSHHQPPSLINDTDQSSFGVFHDSWQRPNNSFGRPANKPQTKEGRMPLQMLPSDKPPPSSSMFNETDASFGVFHDSWNVSAKTNNSLGRSGFNKVPEPNPIPKQENRLPLQVLPKETERQPLQLLPNPQDFSASANDYSLNSYSKPVASQTAESFSVYEDQEESAFQPYHDSWAAGKKPVDREVPMGAPLSGEPNMEQNMDQSYTQFGIPRPNQSTLYSGNSTPSGHRSTLIRHHNFTLDLSVIPKAEPTIIELPEANNLVQFKKPSNKPLATGGNQDNQPLGTCKTDSGKNCGMVNLSTITEESENYKSSQSSSRFTVSSGSSRFSTSSLVPDEINPFEAIVINTMLNKVGRPNRIVTVDGPFPKLRAGCSLELGGNVYSDVQLISEGGFAKVYSAKQGTSTKAIKVQSPSLEWEVAVLDQLHSRLVSQNLHQAVSGIITAESAYSYHGTSVIVMEHHRYGSLLDLVNTKIVGAVVPLYLCCEVMTTVAALHQCGILHADIKPHNFMIRDFRLFSDVRSALGRGVCLVDFSRSIDLQCFPEDVQFTGSSKTDMQCPPMIEGKHWKWQVDYFGLARTVHMLLSRYCLEVTKDTDTGLYTPSNALPRKHRNDWGQTIELLINSTECLPLVELIQPQQRQLFALSASKFTAELSKAFTALQNSNSQQ